MISAAAASLLREEAMWAANPKPYRGVSTGLRSLDLATGGLLPGLIVIGAPTSHGKSALTQQIADHVAFSIIEEWGDGGGSPPGRILVFNFEMTPEQVLMRLASRESRVPSQTVFRGEATREQRDSWRGWAESASALDPVLKLYAGETLSYELVINAIEETMEDGGPPVRIIVIDYVQIMPTEERYSEYDGLRYVVNGLKERANRYRVPVMLVSQLKRDLLQDNAKSDKPRPPSLFDFHGGNVLATAPDQAWLLWNEPVVSESGGSKPRVATVYVAKNRNGPVGETRLLYYPAETRFEDPQVLRIKQDGPR